MKDHEPRKGQKGIELAAELLRGLDRAHQDRLLSSILTKDPGLAGELKKRLINIQYLETLPSPKLQVLLQTIPRDTLALALRAVPETFKDMILGHLPTRAAQEVRDEMMAQGPRRLSDVERAQAEIVEKALASY